MKLGVRSGILFPTVCPCVRALFRRHLLNHTTHLNRTCYDGLNHVPAAFMHGGVESVNGKTEENVVNSKNNIDVSFHHDANTTIIEAEYTKDYFPYQKYVDFNVSTWLQYNKFSDDINKSISKRVTLRFVKQMEKEGAHSKSSGGSSIMQKASTESNRRIHW